MKTLLYLSLLAALGLAVFSFKFQADTARSAALQCLEMQKLAAGGGQAAKDAANDYCKASDKAQAALTAGVKF